MCGFVGFWNRNAQWDGARLDAIAIAMAEQISHRGPDDQGAWSDPGEGIALGHRRLSIIDLSPMGHQPMVSSSGRFVIVYNGEVYNFEEMRDDLRAGGVAFRGHSDTEVILEAIECWGIGPTLERLIGMFAFALWDRHTSTLTLARDRMGIKPMYWGWQGQVLFFGSQLSAFTKHPDWQPTIDRSALSSYLRHNYVPAPKSIYEDIEKLKPGTYVTIDGAGKATRYSYWDLRDIAKRGVAAPHDVSDDEAIEQLDSLLRDAVKRRMVADVPLGAFLSGGIDSSTVVALMQTQSDRPVKTFSIGFHEDGYDEAQHAKAVASHLGTDHTELYVNPRHALDVLPSISTWYDEPFADSSQIPTYLVSELTRRHVTVSLSGDGGDELFAGYNRYFWGDTLWNRFVRWPKSLRHLGAGAIRALSPQKWDQLFQLAPSSLRPPQAGDKIYKLAGILELEGQEELYQRLVSQWTHPGDLMSGTQEAYTVLWDKTLRNDVPGFVDRMQFMDAVTYLPDDILTKVDRASMAISLEARVPLLDHRVVEYAWRLPADKKIRSGQGKWILRKVLDQYVPRQLMDRPKMGFGVPIDHWLRHELRDWAEDLLSEDRLRRDGFFEPAPIREKWIEHLSGKRNWQYPLWTILMFQSWYQLWHGQSSQPARGT